MGESSASADVGTNPGTASGEWTCPTCGSKYPADFAVCPRDATPRAEMIGQSSDPLIGAVLGRTYKVTKLIGEGGMARLYQAEHLRLAAKYAVKVIHHDLATDPSILARFEREARAAARIHSDHVVRVIDVLRTPLDRPCIVTELLEGEDLQARLDRVDRMSVAEAIPIVRQICRAVAAAHAVGVVHRDLKPSNVFLCRGEGAPVVKVFDFGVAKIEDDEKLTRTDSVVGTAAYMSPEQARRPADAGPLADIYSIGAVLYHMLAGEPPYGSAPPQSRFALLLHEEPARPRELEPSIPGGVESVIQHAMARDPKTRTQTAPELDAELGNFDQPVAPVPVGPTGAQITSDPVTAQTVTRTTTGSMATMMALRAKIARPFTAFLAVASSLAVGAWSAAVLRLLIGSPASSGEKSLIGLIALGATAGIAAIHIRILRPRWRSSPAVLRHADPVGRALLAAIVVLGALELLALATAAVFDGEIIGVGGRVVLAGVAGGVGLGWRRYGWDERFRRRLE